MDIAIVVYDGIDELDAIGPYEVFENAREAGATLTTTLCSVDGASTVTASHGVEIGVDGALADQTPDVIVVPGGQWGARDDTGAWAEAERGDLPDALATLYEDGVTALGVCTGGMLLARAGVTDGRPAVTHHGAIDDLRDAGASVIDARVVDDGDLVTSGGVTAGIDLAFYFVRREFGEDIADAVAERMEYEPQGPVYRSEEH